MIKESLRHCRGIGPVRLAHLHNLGIRTWDDVVDRAAELPDGLRDELLSEAHGGLAALDARDIAWFVDRLGPQDRWRILAEFFDQASFFDIETSGLEIDATVTVIVCWHRGRLQTFVEHENLDEFLDLLDDVKLLASFNGSSFDVPRVLDAFHIPRLPCPHLDLRWSCYHAGLTGSLKQITADLQIERPPDLADADGGLAVRLWAEWQTYKDAAARDHLIRYCAADVLLLMMLAQHVAKVNRHVPSDLWGHLPVSDHVSLPQHSTDDESFDRRALVANIFGNASPSKLRIRRRSAR